MTDDRNSQKLSQLDILSRLAEGSLSAEEAEAGLQALEHNAAEPAFSLIRDTLYSLLDIDEDYEYDEDDEDAEEDEFAEARELIDCINSANYAESIVELMECYDLDPEDMCMEIFPLLNDSESGFAYVCRIACDGDLACEDFFYEALFSSFRMTEDRQKILYDHLHDELTNNGEFVLPHLTEAETLYEPLVIAAIQGCSDAEVLKEFLRKKSASASPSVFAAVMENELLSPAEIVHLFKKKTASTPFNPWDEVWTDCFSKNPTAQSAYPTYASVSISLPTVEYAERQRTINANCEEDISARDLTVAKAAELRGAVSAARLTVKQAAVIRGELKAVKINSQTSLTLCDRACFDRLYASGELTAHDRLVGNSLSSTGNADLQDVQARIISFAGKTEANGTLYACSLTSVGELTAHDTVRSENINVSGKNDFKADIHTASLTLSGETTCKREIWCANEITAAGKSIFCGPVTARRFETTGEVVLHHGFASSWGGTVSMMGKVSSYGPINKMQGFSISGSVQAPAIGCTQTWTRIVDITLSGEDSHIDDICAVTTRVSAMDGAILHTNSIGGHSIDVRNTHANLLRADYVSVGAGCHIKLLQYTAAMEISPDAVVERCEKIVHS